MIRLLPLLLLVLVFACSRSSDEPAPAPASSGPAVNAQARQLFQTRCAACHGRDGRGDGPASSSLSPRPRDFHDQSWQKQISDEKIEATIHLGGNAVGKSASMPANPDLAPPVITGLRELIRGFGQ